MTNAMRLLYDDTELQDIYSLGFYNIHDDCDLQLLFQPDAFINVTIQLLRKQVHLIEYNLHGLNGSYVHANTQQ